MTFRSTFIKDFIFKRNLDIADTGHILKEITDKIPNICQ